MADEVKMSDAARNRLQMLNYKAEQAKQAANEFVNYLFEEYGLEGAYNVDMGRGVFMPAEQPENVAEPPEVPE